MVEVQMRLTLCNVRDATGVGADGAWHKLTAGIAYPRTISLSIPEDEARQLWKELGYKLRLIEKGSAANDQK